MKVYVYPTDQRWYRFLRSRRPLDEVNFWRPGGKQAFRVLAPGDLLLFRLRAPIGRIAGGGYFVHFSLFPFHGAWEAFGEKNGTPTEEQFAALIADHRGIKDWRTLPGDTNIGCIILNSPSFWPDEEWIPTPDDYPRNAMVGRSYDVTSTTGRALLEAATLRMNAQSSTYRTAVMEREVGWVERTMLQRTGQGAFRVLVTDMYGRHCAVTREHTLPVLDAAHIRPVTHGGTHSVSNGILLRSDIHTLFDLGYVTVQPDHRFRVSGRLRSEWNNGRIYYELDKTSVSVPTDPSLAPSRELLEWHNDVVFRP